MEVKGLIYGSLVFVTVERKYKADKYSTATELVADFRLILENCYHYWGPIDTLSKRALKLEQMFENKLNSLPE